MSFKYETQYNTPPTAFTQGRPGRPTELVIHHYGDDSATYESSVAWLTRPAASTSAHYVVDAGRVACIVDPDDTAWHAGNWAVNQRAIGIENHPIWSQAREDTLVELCANLIRQYGPMTFSVHQNHSQTACPGRWVARLPQIRAAVNARLTGTASAAAARALPAVLPGIPAYVHKPGKKHYYTPRTGDTLGEIGRHYGVSLPLLVKWNQLPDANTIRAGVQLRVR